MRENSWAACCLVNNQPPAQTLPPSPPLSPPPPSSPPSGRWGFFPTLGPAPGGGLSCPSLSSSPSSSQGPCPVSWICYLSAPPAAHSGLHHCPVSISRVPWAWLLITLCPSFTCLRKVQTSLFSPASFYKTRKCQSWKRPQETSRPAPLAYPCLQSCCPKTLGQRQPPQASPGSHRIQPSLAAQEPSEDQRPLRGETEPTLSAQVCQEDCHRGLTNALEPRTRLGVPA